MAFFVEFLCCRHNESCLRSLPINLVLVGCRIFGLQKSHGPDCLRLFIGIIYHVMISIERILFLKSVTNV